MHHFFAASPVSFKQANLLLEKVVLCSAVALWITESPVTKSKGVKAGGGGMLELE